MTRAAAFLFLAAFVVQTVASMRLLSASSDETSHLPAGYTYLRTGDLRLNPQHPARPGLNAWKGAPSWA